jgi:sugar lactone lactonase YvrE
MPTGKSLLAAVVVVLLLGGPAPADLFVSDTGNSQVLRYTDSGSLIGQFVAVAAPMGLAFDSAGNFYVATNGNIAKYSSTGTLINATFATFTTSNPVVHDVVFDPVNNVLYASVTRSNGNNEVSKITGLGGSTGTPSTLTSAVNTPEGLAVNAAGTTLFVADTGATDILQVNTSNGATSTFVSSPNTGGTPFDLTIGPSNNAGGTPDLYVSLTGGGTRANTVASFEGTTGAFIGTFATGLTNPAGIAFRPSDNILMISNRGTNTIHRSAGSPPGPAGGYSTSVFISGLNNPTYLTFHTAVPEPGVLALFGMASVVMGAYAWRSRKVRKPVA